MFQLLSLRQQQGSISTSSTLTSSHLRQDLHSSLQVPEEQGSSRGFFQFSTAWEFMLNLLVLAGCVQTPHVPSTQGFILPTAALLSCEHFPAQSLVTHPEGTHRAQPELPQALARARYCTCKALMRTPSGNFLPFCCCCCLPQSWPQSTAPLAPYLTQQQML